MYMTPLSNDHLPISQEGNNKNYTPHVGGSCATIIWITFDKQSCFGMIVPFDRLCHINVSFDGPMMLFESPLMQNAQIWKSMEALCDEAEAVARTGAPKRGCKMAALCSLSPSTPTMAPLP